MKNLNNGLKILKGIVIKDSKPPKHLTTWFTSDIHFNHTAVIGFCDRPFTSVEEMNEAIIQNWNKVVKKDDLCIFVGDIFMYTKLEEMKNILSRMNGDRKILVIGNHDKERNRMITAGFSLVVDSMVMTIAGERVHFSHYPFRMGKWLSRWIKTKAKAKMILRWLGISTKPIFFEKYHERRPIDTGQFLIHGHTHSTHKINGKAIHVGVDAWQYKPVNIQQISNMIAEVKKNGPKYTKYDSKED